MMEILVVVMAGSVVVYFLLGLAIGLALKEKQGGSNVWSHPRVKDIPEAGKKT